MFQSRNLLQKLQSLLPRVLLENQTSTTRKEEAHKVVAGVARGGRHSNFCDPLGLGSPEYCYVLRSSQKVLSDKASGIASFDWLAKQVTVAITTQCKLLDSEPTTSQLAQDRILLSSCDAEICGRKCCTSCDRSALDLPRRLV